MTEHLLLRQIRIFYTAFLYYSLKIGRKSDPFVEREIKVRTGESSMSVRSEMISG